MGILCELFVSTRDDAFKFERRLEEAAAPRYIRAEAKGLESVDIEVLWSALVDQPFDPKRHRLEDLYFASHHTSGFGLLKQRFLILKAMAREFLGADIGSSWLYRFPPELVRLLSSVQRESLGTISEKWLSGMGRSSRTASELEQVLLDLQRLARHAQQAGRPMFMWGSV